jgi:outer membrane lipoprotein-sorting protein
MKARALPVTLVGVLALAALAVALALPRAQPAAVVLPPVSTGALLDAVGHANPGPMAGTVQMDERLGLTVLGAQPDVSSGVRTARVWADGAGRRRISLPSAVGEHTIIDDGRTVWSWDSASRTVTTAPAGHRPATPYPTPDRLARFQGGELMGNPVVAAGALLDLLRPASVIRLDPADTVAGRSAYELVLDPLPTERTLMREVRVSVDAATHLPLRVSVLANGSADPALRLGFTDVHFGPQDPSLFRFTPPSGASVRAVMASHTSRPAIRRATRTRMVGSGWSAVLVRRMRPSERPKGLPISGSWGQGRLVSTAIGNAVFTSDGRLAVGAVPAQVLTEALLTEGPRR